MRGEQDSQVGLLTLTSPGKRVPLGHPIREIKRLVDAALRKLDGLFDQMYASTGRPSIPPERLLKAQLLIALYSVRSERQFCERLDYDLLFRFFMDMNLDDPSWDATTFTKNRDRLVQHDVARHLFLGGSTAGQGGRADVGRAFHRRRNADRGVGQSEDLPQEG